MTSTSQPLLANWLSEALDSQLVQNKQVLMAHIKEIQSNRKIAETNTNIHCYFIRNNNSGLPRTNHLIHVMRSAIVNYCIPKSKIIDAKKKAHEQVDPNAEGALFWDARDLFTTAANTGEGGELLLYLLTESILGIPQIIKKMPLKTNTNVHYHGADGVYAKVDETIDKLALYWGESKLHATVKSAVSSALDSIKPFLYGINSGAGGPAQDLKLISDHIDLCDERLETELLKYLDMDNIESHNCVWRGICLAGFDSEHYPSIPNTKTENEIQNEMQQSMLEWEKHVSSHLNSKKMTTIDIELLCVPFPSVDGFRADFLKALGLNNVSSNSSK